MSRHDVESRDPRFQITVGWDNPLNTYFAQVEDTEAEDEDDPVVVWVGTSHGEIQAPEALQGFVAKYGNIPEDILEDLRADRAAMLDGGPSPLQRLAREI